MKIRREYVSVARVLITDLTPEELADVIVKLGKHDLYQYSLKIKEQYNHVYEQFTGLFDVILETKVSGIADEDQLVYYSKKHMDELNEVLANALLKALIDYSIDEKEEETTMMNMKELIDQASVVFF